MLAAALPAPHGHVARQRHSRALSTQPPIALAQDIFKQRQGHIWGSLSPPARAEQLHSGGDNLQQKAPTSHTYHRNWSILLPSPSKSKSSRGVKANPDASVPQQVTPTWVPHLERGWGLNEGLPASKFRDPSPPGEEERQCFASLGLLELWATTDPGEVRGWGSTWPVGTSHALQRQALPSNTLTQRRLPGMFLSSRLMVFTTPGVFSVIYDLWPRAGLFGTLSDKYCYGAKEMGLSTACGRQIAVKS